MDRAHGRTILSTGRASLIRTAGFLSSTEVACALIWLLETTPGPKEDFATLRHRRAVFGTPLPILVTTDFEAMPLRIPAMADSGATPLPIPATEDFGATLLPIPAMADFEATPLPIPATADFAITRRLHPLHLGSVWAIGKLRRLLPAARTGAHSVAWTAAQPPECIAIMDIPASAPAVPPLLHQAVAAVDDSAAEAVNDPTVAGVAVAGADRRQPWQERIYAT